jgi:hypothetical protein
LTLLRKPFMKKEICLMHSPLTIWMNEYTFDFLYRIDLYGDLTLHGGQVLIFVSNGMLILH